MKKNKHWGLMIHRINFGIYPPEWKFEISIGDRTTERIYTWPFWKALLNFLFSFKRSFGYVLRLRK